MTRRSIHHWILSSAATIAAGATLCGLAAAQSPYRVLPAPHEKYDPIPPFGYHATQWRNYPGGVAPEAAEQPSRSAAATSRPPRPEDEDAQPEGYRSGASEEPIAAAPSGGGASIPLPGRDETSSDEEEGAPGLPFGPRRGEPPPRNFMPQGGNPRLQRPGIQERSTEPVVPSPDPIFGAVSAKSAPRRTTSWEAVTAAAYESAGDLRTNLDGSHRQVGPKPHRIVASAVAAAESRPATPRRSKETQVAMSNSAAARGREATSRPDWVAPPATAPTSSRAGETQGRSESGFVAANRPATVSSGDASSKPSQTTASQENAVKPAAAELSEQADEQVRAASTWQATRTAAHATAARRPAPASEPSRRDESGGRRNPLRR